MLFVKTNHYVLYKHIFMLLKTSIYLEPQNKIVLYRSHIGEPKKAFLKFRLCKTYRSFIALCCKLQFGYIIISQVAFACGQRKDLWSQAATCPPHTVDGSDSPFFLLNVKQGNCKHQFLDLTKQDNENVALF